MHSRHSLAAAFAAAASLALVACASARRSEPIVGPMSLASPEIARGQRVFMAHCNVCHPGGEAGLGPAINNKPLPGFLMRFQVRAGLGSMPAFGPEQISDAELDDLIAFLEALRQHGSQPASSPG